ncbi:unnamed protein product [Ranitomeya imitator]|uniref:Uncharacterized protein n=1 Tax=Ranitomeya imitator TaxID=111125 RepID=A0ABN9KXY6_9NEOB|nr:unnamed protein product [Ranitomeya imitator]
MTSRSYDRDVMEGPSRIASLAPEPAACTAEDSAPRRRGGIMGIEINWDCDLDPWAFNCQPQYSFRRLDDKALDESLFPGLSFSYLVVEKCNNKTVKERNNAATYGKAAASLRFRIISIDQSVMQNLPGIIRSPDQTERRTLIKAYGIRFDIQVHGTGGRFNFLELVIFIGSYLSYFGLYDMARTHPYDSILLFVSFLRCRRKVVQGLKESFLSFRPWEPSGYLPILGVPLTCIGIGYRYRRYPILFGYRPILSDTDTFKYRTVSLNTSGGDNTDR